MISVYVAGSSRNTSRARAFIERVNADPRMHLTHDWTAPAVSAAANGIRDCDLTDAQRTDFALADLDAVLRADVLVVLAEAEPTGRGMWVELGFALGYNVLSVARIRTIVSGGARHSIFTAPPVLVDFEVPNVDGDDFEAFNILDELAEPERHVV